MSYRVEVRRNLTIELGQWGRYREEDVPSKPGYRIFTHTSYQQLTGVTAYREAGMVLDNVVSSGATEYFHTAGAGMQTVVLMYFSRAISDLPAPLVTLYGEGTGSTPVLSGQTDQALFDNRLVAVSSTGSGFRLQTEVEVVTGGTTGVTTVSFDQDVYYGSTGNSLSSIDICTGLQSDLESKLANAPFAFSDGSDWRIHVQANPDYTGYTFSRFLSIAVLAPTGGSAVDARRTFVGSAGAASDNMAEDSETEGFVGRMTTRYQPSGITAMLTASGLTSGHYHMNINIIGER